MGFLEKLAQWLVQSSNSNENQVIQVPSTKIKPKIENEESITNQQAENIEDAILEDSVSQYNEQIETTPPPINQPTYQSVPKNLQEQIQDLPHNGTLSIWPPNGEYPGPIIINHPLVLDGKGATIWATKGPVLSIFSDDVILQNLRIEVTGEIEIGNYENNCAILINSGNYSDHNITFENIEVRGSVMGISEEDGEWEYPSVLNIGSIIYGQEYNLRLRIIVPVECKIVSEISGIDFNPHKLNSGANEIIIHLEKLPQDTLIDGNVYLVSAHLKRRIGITAHIVDSKNQDISVIDNDVIWEAESWLSSTSKIAVNIPELNIVEVDIPQLEIQPEITTESEVIIEPEVIINLPVEKLEPIIQNDEIQQVNKTVSLPKTYREVKPNEIFSVKIENNTQSREDNSQIESAENCIQSTPINPIFANSNNNESSSTAKNQKTTSSGKSTPTINPLFQQSSVFSKPVNSEQVSKEDVSKEESSSKNDYQPKKRTQAKPNSIFFQDSENKEVNSEQD